jgi:polyisoprenoid-binding protein YceI
MRTIVRSAVAATLLVFAASASADLADVPSGEYGVDKSHGYITYTYDHQGYSTPHIGFDSFDLTLTLDSANPEKSELNVVIDATSINSRVPAFDGHLNGPNFFDTANHPEITFNSTGMKSTGEDTYDVMGDLTIKGISKPVTITATIKKAGEHPRSKKPLIGVTGEAKVSRADWGLTRAAPMVGDEISIFISVEMPPKESD